MYFQLSLMIYWLKVENRAMTMSPGQIWPREPFDPACRAMTLAALGSGGLACTILQPGSRDFDGSEALLTVHCSWTLGRRWRW